MNSYEEERKKFAEETRRYIAALHVRITELTDANHTLRMQIAGDDQLAQARAQLESAIEGNKNVKATLTR
jgi:hypothetical protein